MHRYGGWVHLRGYFVEIRRGNNVVRRGFVDDATADSEILWVTADASSTRQMFEKSEDYEVWLRMDASSRLSDELLPRSADK